MPLAGSTALPTSCPRHTLPELFKKVTECTNLYCLLDHTSSQGPSVTLPLPETARFKAQSPRLSFEAFCDLTTAIQVPLLNLCFPEHIPGLHTCEAFNCCPNSY